MIQFNVLYVDFSDKKVKPYNVLTYFRDCWKDKCYRNGVKEIKESKSKSKLKDWIIDRSRYMYWARCQYEFLIGSWPFGSYRVKEEMKEFLKNNPQLNLDDTNQNIKFENIIIRDMDKIDIHYQIMMNIDIITDILYKEFNLNN